MNSESAIWRWLEYPWFRTLIHRLMIERPKLPKPPPYQPVSRSTPIMGDFITSRNPWAQALLATIITIGFFIAMFVPGVWQDFVVDEALKQTLQNLFILVIGYYFGSSSSSAKKDEVIASQQATANGTGSGSVSNPVQVQVDDSTPIRTTEVK